MTHRREIKPSIFLTLTAFFISFCDDNGLAVRAGLITELLWKRILPASFLQEEIGNGKYFNISNNASWYFFLEKCSLLICKFMLKVKANSFSTLAASSQTKDTGMVNMTSLKNLLILLALKYSFCHSNFCIFI